jgi:hypothetical protein
MIIFIIIIIIIIINMITINIIVFTTFIIMNIVILVVVIIDDMWQKSNVRVRNFTSNAANCRNKPRGHRLQLRLHDGPFVVINIAINTIKASATTAGMRGIQHADILSVAVACVAV